MAAVFRVSLGNIWIIFANKDSMSFVPRITKHSMKTMVIDRRGKIQNGIRIASTLGLGEDRVLQEVNEAYLLDATVILGKDYNRLDPWGKMEHE
jgi:hypothetical protein